MNTLTPVPSEALFLRPRFSLFVQTGVKALSVRAQLERPTPAVPRPLTRPN